MKIDAHQHFWKFNPVRDAWIDDTMEVIRKDFLPKDLSPTLHENGMDGCIAVQADSSEKETAFLLDLADNNPEIKGVVGWVDLLAADVESRLDYFSKHPKLKGIRHIVQAETDDFVLREDFQNGISKLEKFGLTYDLLVFPNQLENAIALVQKFPNQVFILDHMAKPYIKDKKIKNWQRDIAQLAACENVVCKLSGFVTEADWKQWKELDFKMYFDAIFKAFGTDRILFGSDWPVCLLAAEYKKVLELVQNYSSQFPKEDLDKIMGGNAVAAYNI